VSLTLLGATEQDSKRNRKNRDDDDGRPEEMLIFACISSGANAWLTSAAVVAGCTLLFTVASFWWLNARRGRLESFEPHTYAAAVTPDKVRIRLPLVLYNTRVIPIVVQNLGGLKESVRRPA
jgi:hypothetical protein